MYGFIQPPKIPRLTKSVAEQFIAMHIGAYPSQLDFVKLADSPKEWKHACIPTGVVVLSPRNIQYDTSIIEFAFCRACGKVHYYYEDMYQKY